jgi:hypothetical protein
VRFGNQVPDDSRTDKPCTTCDQNPFDVDTPDAWAVRDGA